MNRGRIVIPGNAGSQSGLARPGIQTLGAGFKPALSGYRLESILRAGLLKTPFMVSFDGVYPEQSRRAQDRLTHHERNRFI
jgi:hypothetical protein